MRGALLLALVTGCLSVPADAVDPGSGPDGGEVTVHCVPGSTLDLAYVSRISMGYAGSTILSLPGMAVLANPGEDTIVLPEVTAAAVGGDPGVLADASMVGGDGGLVLAPGEAKGALAELAVPLVRAQFAEAWSDTESPSLLESYTLSDLAPDQNLAAEIEVPIQVQAGDYAFSIFVTLVADSSKVAGTPEAAARASATCE